MSLLHTPEGAAALTAAMAEQDPDSLAAATRLRRGHPAELAAEALTQAALRRKARTKFGDDAARLFFTPDALEQATRPAVAAWRAERLRAAGIRRVIDLGCGIGADSIACLHAGIDVVAVELDPTTAEHARANLAAAAEPHNPSTAAELVEARAEVIQGDAVALAPELLAGAGPETCVFIDPARRTEGGRTWKVEAFTPPWDFVLSLLDGPHSTVVKLGPGVPKQLLPDDVEALWVAVGNDVVECSLWRTPDARPVHGAVLLQPFDRLGDRAAGRRIDAMAHEPLPVGPVGRYLVEPHGAVIRAGALDQIGPETWLLDPQVAYLSTNHPVTSPFATCFEVLEDLDFNPKLLKAWVREHRVGTLEIKKRAIDVDPAELRKKLQPKGPNSATLVLARTPDGARALVVARLVSARSQTC
ncbi:MULTISPECIES: class I SAM-dependent methyltransferase [unclassified Luteococcus]|uniref:class I SAM-dependent methyltransferase n=1 Tax=unclassified Luteococcus TaxID=2639923 RepID=UPI00313BA64D